MPVALARVEPSQDVRLDRRAARHDARSVLWRESSLKRVRECGRCSVMPGGSVALRVTGTGPDRRAGLAGLTTCGSTWVCPVCSVKIAARRADELGAAVSEAHRRGWSVALFTVTMRHDKGQSLLELWSANSYAWGAVTSGKAWVTNQRDYGIVGWTRVVEVTHGKHGWHVHIHSLLFFDGSHRDGYKALNAGPVLFARWRKALLRKGLAAPIMRKGGMDMRMVKPGDALEVGDYLHKALYAGAVPVDRIGIEVAGGATKQARKENRTPFQILADIVGKGEAVDLALWHEYEKASHNKLQMTWSKGLRAELVREPELTDEEIAAEELGGTDVAIIPPAGLASLTRYWLVPHLLAATERTDDPAGWQDWLRDHGIPWTPPPFVT